MTIALFGISSIYNGFQKFWASTAQLENNFESSFKHRNAQGQVNASLAGRNKLQAKQRALRVLRISEQGEAPSCAGRMVISGRMADVCAELDRLVALEAQGKPSFPH